jgi:SAM-dependent methyltransferase
LTEAAYSEEQYGRAFPAGYGAHFWHQARLRIVRAELRRMGVRRVIDVGCGPGEYVRALRSDGFDCIGCDPGEVRVPTDLHPFVLGHTPFDAVSDSALAGVEAVLLLDVLEHLADPEEILCGVRRRLPGLKGLVVTVPARQELWSELDRRAGHMRRYDRAALESLLVKTGFQVAESTYLFRLLYVPAMLSRHRSRGRAITAPSRLLIHDCLSRMLVADRRWLPASLPGTSLLCVARPATPEADT